MAAENVLNACNLMEKSLAPAAVLSPFPTLLSHTLSFALLAINSAKINAL